MKINSLKYRFLIYIGLIIIVLSLTIEITSYINTSSAIMEEIESNLPDKANDIAMLVRSRLDTRQSQLKAIANKQDIKIMDWEIIESVLNDETSRTEYATIALVETDSNAIYVYQVD